ncbi:MAG: bifunctional adenosylcobinamide kinase/adenosylcobinamide-phosphate guanylyltransferase [Reinekea sp.]|jgi:adenosylcobinamide kinase / adenosylcobinamide-phosphate guanylyltransferase
MNPLILVTGGVKSGKSRFAANCLEGFTDKPLIIATARRLDSEFSARIDRHIQSRPEHWSSIEAPLDLPEQLVMNQQPLLVDCIGVWLTNILVEQPDQLEERVAALLSALEQRSASTVLVSNEVGLGVIGTDSLTRQYIDQLGLLNQAIAERASHVVISICGLPQWLKGTPF